jgi:hypothetical protein
VDGITATFLAKRARLHRDVRLDHDGVLASQALSIVIRRITML